MRALMAVAIFISCLLGVGPTFANETSAEKVQGDKMLNVCFGHGFQSCVHLAQGHSSQGFIYGSFLSFNGVREKETLINEAKFKDMTQEFLKLARAHGQTQPMSRAQCSMAYTFKFIEGRRPASQGQICPSRLPAKARAQFAAWRKRVAQ